jgi:hypothetical protein
LGVATGVGATALPAAAAAQLTKVQPALDTCWSHERAKGDVLEAMVEIRMEIVGPGRVAAASVSASREASATLRGCVRDAFAGFFTGSIGPAPVEAVVRIDFEGEVGDAAVRAPSACAASCDGELEDDGLLAVRSLAQQAAHCFRRPAAAGEAPTLGAGAVDVELRLAEDGSTCGVALVANSFGRPSLDSCLRETFGRGIAPEHPRGCVNVRVPMRFSGR